MKERLIWITIVIAIISITIYKFIDWKNNEVERDKDEIAYQNQIKDLKQENKKLVETNKNIRTEIREIFDKNGLLTERIKTILDLSIIKARESSRSAESTDVVLESHSKNAFVGVLANPIGWQYMVGGGIIVFKTLGLGIYFNHNMEFFGQVFYPF